MIASVVSSSNYASYGRKGNLYENMPRVGTLG